jgi:fructosamine-3-kinase
MSGFFAFLSRRLSAHFHQTIQITAQQQVFGGDINKTFQLQTNAGSFFLKMNDGSLRDMFEKEFLGLQLLYQTKTIKIPQPVLYGNLSEPVIPAKAGISSNNDKIFLVTEFIQKGNPSKNFWQTFAQQLAALHKHSNERFGLDTDNYIGSLHQQNNFCNTWSEFYATQRILSLAQLAFNQNKFDKQDVSQIEKLCTRFNELFPAEKPSLIHGDLWSGNFISDENGTPVIYDPAVYYGSREMDIAMSLLFGGFDKRFYDYYNEVFPLQPNWKERVQLYQLYPVLVHLILFGGHYYNSAINIIRIYN